MKQNEDGTWSIYTDEEIQLMFKAMTPRRYRCTPSTGYGTMYYFSPLPSPKED